MRASHKAWLAGGLAMGAYEAFCPPGETLSEGLDPLVEHPVWRYVIGAAIGVTALHLMNLIPEELDPFTKALAWKD